MKIVHEQYIRIAAVLIYNQQALDTAYFPMNTCIVI